jgi:hypothetical protein
MRSLLLSLLFLTSFSSGLNAASPRPQVGSDASVSIDLLLMPDSPEIRGVQHKTPDNPCWDFDYENNVCLDGGGIGTGTQYTCDGTCNRGCNLKGQSGSSCEFWGWHNPYTSDCPTSGDQVYHTHTARQI